MNRLRIKIVGESGAGLLSTGEIVTKALVKMGFYVVAEREYQSLIKGGYACFSINISDEEIYGISSEVDILLSIDQSSLHEYVGDLKGGGVLIHGYERLGVKADVESAEQRGCKIVHLKVREIAEEMGGNVLMKNVVLAGMLWKNLGFDYSWIKAEVERKFASKPRLLAIDLKCLEAGYERVEISQKMQEPNKKHDHVLIEGNHAIALGAVHAGCDIYYAYPMSPASSILTHIAKIATKSKVQVKQVEDEISVANMVLGSMYMGARAFCATSGGGYDLMTETVSLAAITETPFVAVIAQRPGPGTGLPTWTGQGDLNLALYSSHGEFTRLVLAVSDPSNAFDLIQHAFNYAEEFQIPVILLTEKAIGETMISIPQFEQGKIPIKRGITSGKDLENIKSTDRFKITENGISKRWLPSSSETFYFANGDEHKEDGSITEDAKEASEMYAKRIRKTKTLKAALPEAEIFGEKENAEISFVGWGSSLNIMRDTIKEYAAKGIKVNYLHFTYIWPLKTKTLEEFFSKNKNVHLIEGNYTGQLGKLIEGETDLKFKGKFLKYNGRSIFLEDVKAYIDSN